MLSFETTGMRVYNKFVEERLKPNSTKSITDPLKKVMLKTCKSAIKPRKIKVNEKTKELRGNCNLFARCALTQAKRNIETWKSLLEITNWLFFQRVFSHLMAPYLMDVSQSLMHSDAMRLLIEINTNKSRLAMYYWMSFYVELMWLHQMLKSELFPSTHTENLPSWKTAPALQTRSAQFHHAISIYVWRQTLRE